MSIEARVACKFTKTELLSARSKAWSAMTFQYLIANFRRSDLKELTWRKHGLESTSFHLSYCYLAARAGSTTTTSSSSSSFLVCVLCFYILNYCRKHFFTSKSQVVFNEGYVNSKSISLQIRKCLEIFWSFLIYAGQRFKDTGVKIFLNTIAQTKFSGKESSRIKQKFQSNKSWHTTTNYCP